MKRNRILIAIVLMMVFGQVDAQIIKGEAFAGFGISQVDGDDCYGYKRFRGQAGVGALVPLTNWLDVGLEVLYNPKGAYHPDSIAYSDYYAHRYDLKLNYVEIPVMFYLTDKDKYSIGIGASYGRLVSFWEKVDGVETDSYVGDGKLRWKDGYDGKDLGYIRSIDDLSDPAFYDSTAFILQNSNSYKNHDISVCADMRVRLWKGLHLQFRYQYSMAPIRTVLLYDQSGIPSKVRMQYNNQLILRLTYIFGEQRSDFNREVSKQKPR